MGRIRILAIEDDAAICRMLQHSLAREDFALQLATSGEEGLAAAGATVPDLVLLDLGLPGIDGLEVCRRLRGQAPTRSVPVIILSGKGEEADVVRGLEMGADDYLVKPISPRLLNARLRAVLRRREAVAGAAEPAGQLQLAGIRVDPDGEEVRLDGHPLELNPVEYRFIYHLVYFLAVEKTPAREAALGVEGTALYAENRLERLLPVLDALLKTAAPPEPVLAVFAAMALQARDSGRCRALLEGARQAFCERNLRVGELASNAFLLPHLLLFEGDGPAAAIALQRIDALYLELFPALSSFARILVSQALALGHALLFSDFERAKEHLAIAETLVEERGLVNLSVLNHLIRHMEFFIHGQAVELGRGVEAVLRLRSHPQVSSVHRALIGLCQLGDLSLRGDFGYLRRMVPEAQAEFAPLFPPESPLRQRLVAVQVEADLWEGDGAGALALLRSVPARGLLRPLFDGQQLLAAALAGSEEPPPAPDAMASVAATPGSFAAGQGALYAVRALRWQQRNDEADALLASLSAQFAAQPWTSLQLQAAGLELAAALAAGAPPNAVQCAGLASLLRELRQRRLVQLGALLPEDMRVLYRAARLADIETDYVITCGQTRLHCDFSEPGGPLPLLWFDTLGGLQLRLKGEIVLRQDDFSRSQRDCLAALVAAPAGRVDQETMQLLFWPDSSPDKARSNLDTMLSRLRKTLQEKIGPLQAKNYLKLQKGVVSLEHVETDAHRLLAGLRRGHECLAKGEYWQAELAFSGAFTLWKGAYMPGACATDLAAEFAERIHLVCLEATLRWAELLLDLGHTARAEAALLHALGNDRSHEALVQALYRCYMRSGRINRALALLQQFEEALRRDGCHATEIARALATIKVRPAQE